MKPRFRLSLLIVLLGLAPFFSSCLIGSHSHEENSGTFIGDATFARVGPGDTMEFVRELFGPPAQEIATSSEEGVIWKWTYESETRDRGSLFLVFNTNNSRRTDGTVFVEFEKGVVIKSWRDWNTTQGGET